MTNKKPVSAAVIGLGSMGLGIAKSIARRKIPVAGFDVNANAVASLSACGGIAAASAADAAKNRDVVVVVVVNAAQTRSVLFGDNGAAKTMKSGGVVISCATMSPDDARGLERDAEEMGILYLDAPISGGATKATDGQLTVMASGAPEPSTARIPCLMPLQARFTSSAA